METGGQLLTGGYKSFADKLKQNTHPRNVIPLPPPSIGTRRKDDISTYKKGTHLHFREFLSI